MSTDARASATFAWRALDDQGRSHSGELQATHAAQALLLLQQRGLRVVGLQPLQPQATAPDALAGRRWRLLSSGRIGAAQRIVLLEEFATLLQAGVSLAEAAPSLETAYAGTPLGPPLTRLRQALQAGRPVAQAFRDAQLALPEHAHSLIEAGDASGRLGPALAAAAAQLEHEHAIRQQMATALVYPAVLVVAGVLAVFVIFVAVVPRFATLLGSGRAEVPALSRWVIEAGMFFQAHVLGSTLALAGALGCAAVLLGLPAVRQALRDGLARLPVTGPWLRSAEIGRWATLLGTLLDNRVPLLAALELSARAVGLSGMRRHLEQAQGEIRRGRALSEVLAGQGWVAPTRVNLVRVGERAGELPRMMLRLGQMHTEASRQQLRRVLALLEPAAIVLIGGVIGVIMVAVVLAIASLDAGQL